MCIRDSSSTALSDEGLKALSLSENITRLQSLNISACSQVSDAGLKALFNARKTAHLTHLKLSNTRITGESLMALGQSQFTRRLSSVDLRWCRSISDYGFKLFFASANSRNLTHVELSNTKLGDDGFVELASCAKLESVRVQSCSAITDLGFTNFFLKSKSHSLSAIDFSNTKLADEAIVALTSSRHLRIIETLILSRCESITDAGFEYFFKNAKGARIRKLEISETKISDNGLVALAESELLKTVAHLDLFRCSSIANETFGELLVSRHLSNVETLELSETLLEDEGMLPMEENDSLTMLQRFNVRWCSNLSDEGIQAVLDCSSARNLLALDLASTKIGDEGLAILAQSDNLKQLQRLSLSRCIVVTASGFVPLFSSQNFASTQTLDLSYTKIGDESIHALAVSDGLKALNVLSVKCCLGITANGFKSLFADWKSQKIQQLDLSETNLNDDSVEVLGNSMHFNLLQTLSCKLCAGVSDDGWATLFSVWKKQRVTTLELSETKLGDRTLNTLTQGESLKNVHVFKIEGCKDATDEAIRDLLISSFGGRLTVLELSETKISNDSLIAFSEVHNFRALHVLNIQRCPKVTEAALKEINKSPLRSIHASQIA
eukprot:TRINITY_DN3063_c0_g1_i3.p1 TRINITY_DN3063_c0_g1~~TRINITY_DN3063_c0_g1_i3.p1  ORF type:complete len:609 (+),score=172.85 TRINITY_DN3063_c0_g1_i3:66-1892(+)